MLDSLDVSETHATVNVHESLNSFREDVAKASPIREQILQAVPCRNGDYISTPIVIDEEGN